MRELLTISINTELKKSIEDAAKMYNVSKSEIVRKAIERYIIHKEFNELRSILMPYGEKSGYYTDEDIFKDIS